MSSAYLMSTSVRRLDLTYVSEVRVRDWDSGVVARLMEAGFDEDEDMGGDSFEKNGDELEELMMHNPLRFPSFYISPGQRKFRNHNSSKTGEQSQGQAATPRAASSLSGRIDLSTGGMRPSRAGRWRCPLARLDSAGQASSAIKYDTLGHVESTQLPKVQDQVSPDLCCSQLGSDQRWL